jgi:hypothetical protein
METKTVTPAVWVCLALETNWLLVLHAARHQNAGILCNSTVFGLAVYGVL